MSCPLSKMPTISTSFSAPLVTVLRGELPSGSKSVTGTVVLGMGPGEKAEDS